WTGAPPAAPAARRGSAAATGADTGRPSTGTAGRRAGSCGCDPPVAHRDDPGHAGQLLGQDGVAGPGELIRSSAVVGGPPPDPRGAFQAGQRAVQGAWLHLDAAERGDVFHDRVTVPGTVGQAGQDQQGRVCEPAEIVELLVHPPRPCCYAPI